MTNKFNIADCVVVTKKDGTSFCGMVRSFEINPFNFRMEYDVDYYSNGVRTMMGIPETAITLM